VTGELGFLPIHAAGSYEGSSPVCTADYVVSSYIPTLSALTRARASWHPVLRTDLAGLLICEESSDNGSERHLPNAAREIEMVRASFETANAQVLNTASTHTSLAEMRSLLAGSSAHILHAACHGVQDADPLKSAIMLQDGKLAIEDIMGFSLPFAVLAFLSACQTAKGDRKAPDQAVHIAASMLFCGFRSVIGTMWCVYLVWAHSLLIVSVLGLCTTRTALTWRGAYTRRCSGKTTWTWTMSPTRWTRPSKAFAIREYQHLAGPFSCIWVVEGAQQESVHRGRRGVRIRYVFSTRDSGSSML
jgi:hypothetical protein